MRPKYNCRLVFNKEQEKQLSNYLIKSSKMCYGLNTTECRKLAYELAQKNNLKMPASWENNKCAGADWLSSFIKRNNEISIRLPEACSLSRATSFNRHNVMLFFDKLQTILMRHPTFGDGSRIFNLDETGVTTVQNPKKVIAEKGIKRLGKVTSAERSQLITVCCIINAYGQTVPPSIIFPRVNFKQHMLTGAPRGSLGLAAPSGWMNYLLFIDVLNHFIKFTNSSKQNPTLLIMDNHESHISINCIDLAKENGVTILTLPPHCSNRMQPLDVSIYGPFKSYYNHAVDSWLQNHPGRTLTIYDVSQCIGLAFEKSMTQKNITAGFKATGIFPFDRDIFTDDDFLVSDVTNRQENNQALNLQNTNSVNESHVTTVSETEEKVTGENDLQVNANLQETQQNCTNTYFSPEDIRGYPKAQERKVVENKRYKAKSTIITDTPERNEIEMKRKLAKRSSNNKNIKKVKKNLFPKETPINNDQSDSDNENISGKVTPLMLTSDEEFDDNDLTIFEELSNKDPKEGDYVLVKFKIKKSEVYYVAKILREKDEENDVEVSYLRRFKKSSNIFCLPGVPDLASVSVKDIKGILPPPKVKFYLL